MAETGTARAEHAGYAGKRALDLCLAIALALPALLITSLCALAVALEARANPFFFQTRVGLHQRPFRLVKLRTLPKETADLPSHEVDANAILRTGKILRATKIDELPQLWNVLTGAMSLVGPRPCLPKQQELIDEREAREVYTLRPGITGPAQLAGIDMSTPAKLAEKDATYLSSQSLAADLKMLLFTFIARGSGDAALKKGS